MSPIRLGESTLLGQRLQQLDGLRGVAAISVVAFHILSAFSPELVAEQEQNTAWIAYTPLSVFWNGTFAVSIFFVLSGFVVTHATLRKSDPLWIDAGIRYLRLAIPATVSALIGWLLLSLYPTSATEASSLSMSPWLRWTYQDVIPGPISAVYDGLLDIFLSGGSFFNNALWTMRPELLGSFACFAVCLFKTAHVRLCFTFFLALVVIIAGKYEYECFVLGIVLREAWASGRLPTVFPISALIVGLILGSQSIASMKLLGLDWLPTAFTPQFRGGLLYPIAAVLVVYGCMRSGPIAAALSGRTGEFLGAISFPLYLIHVPLLCTLVADLYLTLSGRPILFSFALALFSVLMIIVAYAIERWLERPFLRLLSGLRSALRAKSGHEAVMRASA
ncbi:acyltransferase family protein [Methylobacterium sp. E-066]|uniref:acyltransferase family protein n=1 Tax=Methylobacterium sp. E-066 TaxID=2836584 RepID=UPI001FBAE4E6|nr:acyltransferase [Methylobacterium sp. E-066]MCJ2143476.1 acyltransferase [Methylobacterium sp. E-066]